MAMTREIYEAMKRRISIKPLDDEDKEYYDLMGWTVPENATFYFFNADGLNEGVDDIEDEVYSIRQPMQTHNLWNVCQRFYSFIKHYIDIDKRLLKMDEPIYAVVRGNQVVGGPYPNRKLAEADCYKGEEVIEVLPTDQGYEEFKSCM